MIEHNTPRLEQRIEDQKNANKFVASILEDLSKQIPEFKKQLNSGILRVNELELLKNLRDGKYILLDVEKHQVVPMKWF